MRVTYLESKNIVDTTSPVMRGHSINLEPTLKYETVSI